METIKSFNPAVVVVAAGRGERAGSPEEGPKQYRQIGTQPVIAHTLSAFIHWGGADAGIIVVIHPDDDELFYNALTRVDTGKKIQIVHGGITRQQSVLNGLLALQNAKPSHVLIHDAVRPFINTALLERVCVSLQAGNDAVLPGIAVSDTLKRANKNKNVTETVDRTNLYGAQTPQAFSYNVILDAHKKAVFEGCYNFTDDARIAEWAGSSVKIVDGLTDNIKLTFKRDISMADEKLSNYHRLADIRTGNGYDVHKLVPGGGVTLCGILIPHDVMLSGHSDADVAFHALTDALLATCGAGDIGDHFPPSDEQWRGADSKIFLAHAAKIVREKGGVILNADVTLIAEEPKIGPHRTAMRQKIANCLDIDIGRCSVKATTNETIGFVGRKEGIAAIATASVNYGFMK